MPAIVRTFTTRIDSHPALTASAELESRVERKLYAALRSGRKFTGDLAISFYQQFGISAKTLDGIHRQLKAKLTSIAELAKLRAAEIEVRIAARGSGSWTWRRRSVGSGRRMPSAIGCGSHCISTSAAWRSSSGT
jgi:hypothetical protein